MKNLKGKERIVGGIWRRPVKIKELELKSRSEGIVREIGFEVRSLR